MVKCYNHKEFGICFIEMKGCKNVGYYANVKVIKDFNIQFLVVLDTDLHSSEGAENIKKTLVNEYKVKDFVEIINRLVKASGGDIIE